jgi:threonine dehydrogenase-like Zn-dependent dehydrogenase
MKTLVLQQPGQASIEAEPAVSNGAILLRLQMVGLCRSDLSSFRGLNPLVSFSRIPGHEVSSTVVEGDSELPGCGSRTF